MAKNNLDNIKHYGYEDPVILGTDYHMGGGFGLTSGKRQLVPNRDWRPFLSQFEPQRRAFETFSCTQFATIKPTHSIIKLKYNEVRNDSERALSILSGNSPRGNSPNITAEALRKGGLIMEERLPFTNDIKDWGEYMTPDPLPDGLKEESKAWGFSFLHEWVHTSAEKLWKALPFSTLGVSVMAWRKEGEFFVKEKGERDTHWTDIVFGKYREHWIIDDSYLHDGTRFKKLPWNYPFGYAKLYAVNKKEREDKPFWCRYFPNWPSCNY